MSSIDMFEGMSVFEGEAVTSAEEASSSSKEDLSLNIFSDFAVTDNEQMKSKMQSSIQSIKTSLIQDAQEGVGFFSRDLREVAAEILKHPEKLTQIDRSKIGENTFNMLGVLKNFLDYEVGVSLLKQIAAHDVELTFHPQAYISPQGGVPMDFCFLPHKKGVPNPKDAIYCNFSGEDIYCEVLDQGRIAFKKFDPAVALFHELVHATHKNGDLDYILYKATDKTSQPQYFSNKEEFDTIGQLSSPASGKLYHSSNLVWKVVSENLFRYQRAKKEGLPFLERVSHRGFFKDVFDLSGLSVQNVLTLLYSLDKGTPISEEEAFRILQFCKEKKHSYEFNKILFHPNFNKEKTYNISKYISLLVQLTKEDPSYLRKTHKSMFKDLLHFLVVKEGISINALKQHPQLMNALNQSAEKGGHYTIYKDIFDALSTDEVSRPFSPILSTPSPGPNSNKTPASSPFSPIPTPSPGPNSTSDPFADLVSLD